MHTHAWMHSHIDTNSYTQTHTHIQHTNTQSMCCIFALPCREEYLGVYAAFGMGQSILVLFSSFTLALGGIMASILIHRRLLINILRLPMSFFDTTPSGRILNQFSKDIYTIDEKIPQSVNFFLSMFFSVISTIFVISFATPWFMIVIIPLIIMYFLVQVRIMSL